MAKDNMTNDGNTAVQDQVAALTAQVTRLVAERDAAAKPDSLTPEQLADRYHLDPEHLEMGAPAINAAAHVATQKAREQIQIEIAKLRQDLEQQADDRLDAVFLSNMDRLARGWEAINATKEFNDWLRDTGKDTDLRQARDAYDAVGCAQVFRDFVTAKQAAAQAGQPPQQPPQARPAWENVPGGAQNNMSPRSVPQPPQTDPQGPVYRLDDVMLFLSDYAKGLRPTMDDAKTFREYNKAVQERRVS